MPRRAAPPVELGGRPGVRRELVGRVSDRRLNGPAFASVFRGVHVAADVEQDHGVRAAAALAVVRGPAVLGGLSAAWAFGVREARDDEPVHLLARRPAPRSRDGLLVQQCDLGAQDVVRTSIGWTTSPARTVVDLLRWLDLPRSLCVAEAVAHRTGVTGEDARAALERLRRARGARVARERLARLDPRAESPRETMLRLLLLDAGLPPPVPQHEVFDGAGRFVARLDLAWPAARVAVEYDGDHHRERGQHSRDLARHNRLRALGWVVLQVDAEGFVRPEALLRQLRLLLAERSGR